MRNPRNTIYNALLAKLQAILPQTQVQTFSRVWRPHTSYSTAQLPAVVLDEKREGIRATDWGVLGLYHLQVDVWLYLAAATISQIPGQETVIPMDAVNDLLDLLENTPLANPPASGMPAETLGGLVQRVYIEGDILKVAGIGDSRQQYSLARVPLVIFTT